MVNETFFEICFKRVGGEPISVVVLESPTEIVAIFPEICKKYVEENFKTESDEKIVICENTDLVLETLRKNHILFPHNIWYLVLSKESESSSLTLYHKNRVLNSGWVYNSESTKVTEFGQFSVRQIKLDEKLANKINNINQREYFAVTQLNEANLKCFQNVQRSLELSRREKEINANDKNLINYANDLDKFSQQLNLTKEELVSWEKDLIKWENFLDSKEKDNDNEINYLKTKVLAYESKIDDYEKIIKEKNRELAFLRDKIDSLEAIDSDSEVIILPPPTKESPKKASPTPVNVQQPHIYLDELKDFFANKHWRRHDFDDEKDICYLEKIEKNVYRTDVSTFDKAKSE